MSKKKRRTELNQLIEKYKRYSLVEEVEKSLQEKKGIFYSSNELFLSDLYEEKYYDLNAYSSLLESIKKDGLLYPLIIVKQNDGFEIINGAKRFLLAKKLGIEKLPCFLINLSGKRKVSYIVENIIAENDSPLLKAHCFYTLSHKYHYSDIEIAKEANISLAQEKNLKRLLNLPEFLKKALNSFQLSYSEGRALLDLPLEKQKQLFEELKANKLSVRDLERERRQYFGKKSTTKISLNNKTIKIKFTSEKEAEKAFSRLKKLYVD